MEQDELIKLIVKAGKILDEQNVPQHNRFLQYWDGEKVVTLRGDDLKPDRR